MAEDEYKFRISAEDEATDKVDQASAAANRLKDTTQQSGAAAGQAAQQEQTREQVLRQLRARLVELQTAELAEQQATREGATVSAEAGQQGEARRREISQISRELGQQAAAERLASDAVRDSTDDLLGVERAQESREQSLRRMRDELLALQREELDEQQLLKRGERQTAETNVRTVERQRRIRALSGELAKQAAAERMTNHSVEQSAHGMRGAAEAGKGLRGVLGAMPGSLGAMASGAGVASMAWQALTDHVEAANRELERNAQLTRQSAEERLDLAALNRVDDPNDIEFLDAVAGFSGRTVGSAARAMTTLRSRFPNAPQEDIYKIVIEAAIAAQSSSASLATLSKGIAITYTGTKDPRVSANILSSAVDQAGEPDPERFIPLLGKFKAIGKEIGGMSDAEAAGYTAAATGLDINGDEAITGLKNLLISIAAPVTDEQKALHQRLGLNRNDLGMSLRRISEAKRTGQLTKDDLIMFSGRESLAVASALANPVALEEALRKVQTVVDEGSYEGNINAEKAKSIMGSNAIQPLNLLAKQSEQRQIAVRDKDVNAAHAKVGRSIIETILAKAVQDKAVTPADSEAILGSYDAQVATGTDPIDAADMAEIERSVWSRMTNPSVVGSRPRVELSDPLREQLEAGPQMDADVAFDKFTGGNNVTLQDNRQITNTHINTQLNAPGTQSPYTAPNGRRR